MDAKGTWDLWRRILCEPALAEALFEPDFEARAARFGVSVEDARIARAYASTPQATRFFVTTYRYRLVSSFGHALQSGAPLTYRALRTAGHDMRALGERCLDALGWRDRGPYVYRFCEEILGYLRGTGLAAAVPGLLETTALEGASVALVQRLATAPAATWPARSEREAYARALERYRFELTGTGVVVRTERSLTTWLRSRAEIGKAPLEDRPESYLVYLPSSEESARIVPVGAAGAALYSRLADLRPGAAPPTSAEIERSGGQLRWLEKYAELGVVAGRPTDS
jgi:hypothetical protein